jgi:hypothetical protein
MEMPNRLHCPAAHPNAPPAGDNRALARRLAAVSGGVESAADCIADLVQRHGALVTEAALVRVEAANQRRGIAFEFLDALAGTTTERTAQNMLTKQKWLANLNLLDPDIAGFVEDFLQPSPDTTVDAEAVYLAYRDWCAAVGFEPASQARFNRRLIAIGVSKVKANGVAMYQGVRLSPLA